MVAEPGYGRKTGTAPVESGTLLWPNILETLSDSVRDPPAARLPVCGRGLAGFDFQIVGGPVVTRGLIRYATLPCPTFNLRFLVPGRVLTSG